METKIYYFSGTGNSLAVARNIAQKTDGVKVISMAEALINQNEICGEKIGIVMPTYWYGLPHIVMRFIKKIKASNYIFAVATHSGSHGITLIQVEKLLKKNSQQLSSSFSVRMPPFYKQLSDEKKEKIFQASDDVIKHIVKAVKTNEGNKLHRRLFILEMFYAFVYRIYSSKIHIRDRKFAADNKCNGCGLCENVCPVQNIEIIKERPEWAHRCEQCFACFQCCPKESIQYGSRTKGVERYCNPQVKVDDFLICRDQQYSL